MNIEIFFHVTRQLVGRIMVGVSLLCIASIARSEIKFTRDVAPILVKRCIVCHGERTNLGGWRANTYQFLRKPGVSGLPAVTPGRPERSRIFQLITEKQLSNRMPKGDEPLSKSEISRIRSWIQAGAKFDGSDFNASLKSLLGPRSHPRPPAGYSSPAPVLALALSPTGREVASGGYNELLLWDAATGALKRRISGLPQQLHSIVFVGNGSKVLCGGGVPGEYGELAIIDLATGVRKVIDTFPDMVSCAAVSRDGRRLAAGCVDCSVRCYSASDFGALWVSRVHSDCITSVDFSADGRFVASGSKDFTVKVNDAATGALFTTYNGHNKQFGKYKGQFPLYVLRFDPVLPVAYSAGGGPTVQIWDPVKAAEETGTAADMEERFAKESHAKHIEHGFRNEVYSLAIRKGSLFAASGDGSVRQFDLASRALVRTYSGHTDWVFALDVEASGAHLATGSYDGEIRIWDVNTGALVTRLRNQPAGHMAIATAAARDAPRTSR